MKRGAPELQRKTPVEAPWAAAPARWQLWAAGTGVTDQRCQARWRPGSRVGAGDRATAR
jgi:hypothetical protein